MITTLDLKTAARETRAKGYTYITEILEDAAERMEELEEKVATLSCDLIEARNPGIDRDGKWIAERARRLSLWRTS